MDQTHDTAFDWTQFLDDGPSEPGTTVSPVDSTIQSPTVSRAAAKPTTPSSIPLTSEFATGSSSKSTTTNSSSSSSPSQNKNNGNKSKFPWWLLLLLLFILGGSSSAAMGFNPIYRALKVVGIEGSDGKDGNDGNDGQNGIDGQDGKDGTNGTSTAYSGGTVSGTQGTDGQDGKDGTNGSDGADGADGGDACISGICVSRQSTSPGTQETGNINIDGAVLASSLTTTDNVEIGGTATVAGHSSFGSGNSIDGGSTAFDVLAGTSAHSSILSTDALITDINGATTAYDGIFGVLKLDPSSSTAYTQINGINGGLQIESGNSEDFVNQLNGINGVVIHAGTGTVSGTYGANYVIGNTGGGTITSGTGLNIIPINLSGTITTYKGINIASPVNAGTMTNSYGLYINDQSGPTTSYNLYSAGLTSNNFFQGFVGIGAIAGPLDGQVHIVNDGSGNSFKVSDTGYADTSPFVIDSDGNVGIKDATPSAALDINGTIIVQNANGNHFQHGGNNVVSIYSGLGNGTVRVNSSGVFDFSNSSTSTNTPDAGLARAAAGALKVTDGSSGSGSIQASKFIGISGTTTWLSSDGSNTGLFVTDSANPQTGANRAFHITADSSAIEAFKVSGGAAAQIVAVVKGAASQSANLQEWQNSSGTRLSAVDSSGTFKVLPGQTGVNGLTFYDNNFAIGMSSTDLAITTVSGSSNGISFTNNGVGGTPIMRIRGDGNVGIGESSPGVKLHITSTSDENVLRLQDSDGTCDHNPEAGSETVSCSSDVRLKTDITDAASVLSEINGLKVHDYTIIASGKQTTGVIAQEVLETNPDMVHLGDDGYYKVDQYNVWKLVKGIQELSTNSDNLEKTFTTALEETNGNVTAANEQIASLGLRVDELNQTLETYAQQLADHEQRIQSLEAKVEQLQAN